MSERRRKEVIDLDEVSSEQEMGSPVEQVEGDEEQPGPSTQDSERPGTGETPALHDGAGEDACAPGAQSSVPSPQSSPDPEVEWLRAELEATRAQGLAAYRRALLAENAGRLVPELVMGSTMEDLDRSLEVARRAFETAKTTVMEEIAATPVPAGNPVRQERCVEGMSSLEKIAHGLKRE